MARKKKATSIEQTQEIQAAPIAPKPYKEARWGGLLLYQCPLCPYDTFERVDMLKHLVHKHNDELALVELVKWESNPKEETSATHVADVGGGGMTPPHPNGEDAETFEIDLKEVDHGESNVN